MLVKQTLEVTNSRVIDRVRQLGEQRTSLINTMLMNHCFAKQHADPRNNRSKPGPSCFKDDQSFFGIPLFKAEFSKQVNAHGIVLAITQEPLRLFPFSQKI